MELGTCTLLFAVGVVSFLFLWGKLFSRTRYRFPPGPRGLPFLGCPWYLFRETHILLTELAQIWGDCFTLNILGERMVVFNTPEAARKTLNKVEYAGRAGVPSFMAGLRNSSSMMAPTQQWSQQRKLVYKILNMYGEGVQAAEDIFVGELSHVTDWIDTHKGGPINLDDVICPSLMNVITILLQGRRYDYDSGVLKNIKMLTETMNHGFENSIRLAFAMFPFLNHINIGPGKIAFRHRRSTQKYISDIYEESKATYDPSITRGMIDFMLHYQNEARQKGEVMWLEEKHIEGTLLEMIAGGSNTTRPAICSFFLISLQNPEVMKRIQEEIDNVIGPNRPIKIKDRSDMPYTSAAMLELFRYISHLPLSVPTVTTEDVALGDYFLPKRTTIVANSWAFHHDEKLWPEPWEFKPERFLDDDMKLLPPEHPNRKNLHPFGIGMRVCPGETFAKSRIFLFIATLLQRFEFLPDPDRPLPSCDPRNLKRGLILYPKPYYVRVKSRD